MLEWIRTWLLGKLDKPDERNEPDDETSKDDLTPQALAVHKLLYKQVHFLKERQWKFTNSVGIIYGAIFIIYGAIFALSGKELSRGQVFSLIGATALAALYGVFLLCVIQYDLGNARIKLDKANLDIFGRSDWKSLGMGVEREPYKRGLEFTIPMIVVLVGGALILGSTLLLQNRLHLPANLWHCYISRGISFCSIKCSLYATMAFCISIFLSSSRSNFLRLS
jgi:hypothetical protein